MEKSSLVSKGKEKAPMKSASSVRPSITAKPTISTTPKSTLAKPAPRSLTSKPAPPKISSSSSSSTHKPSISKPAASPSRPPQKLTAKVFDKNKQADLFTVTKKHKTSFGVVYSNGGIPCRVNHGSVKHTVQWDIPVYTLEYDPLIVTCAEGLLETEHPYVFLSRLAFKEMVEAPSSEMKIIPLLGKISLHIRNALRAPEKDTFIAGLEALEQLSLAVGPALNPHLSSLLVPINKKIQDKSVSPIVNKVLQVLDQSGGPTALPIIKSKVPLYSTA
eukprot:TRINITY_DN2196_c0_g1_i2.p1 TRINITY_DN2196_c0_g1~~TRINITY_DN2196_c0_g1_i2.p1  ORF type:complete len:275 (+),score=54.21 TRINITY_DN2196_c0_g1_i2:320-1144(+)